MVAGLKALSAKIGPDAVIFPNLANQPLLDLHWRDDLWKRIRVGGKSCWDSLGWETQELLTPNLPNIFLAIVPATRAKELGVLVAEAVSAEWKRIADAVWQSCDAADLFPDNEAGFSKTDRRKGACILPHGVLFRGGAEAAIRREIVSRGYIKGIIGLPANLFYGTGIPACIIVLDKENASARKGIFMVDASKAFIKDGNKNRLRAQDIHKIVDAFTRLAEIPRYSRMVSLTET